MSTPDCLGKKQKIDVFEKCADAQDILNKTYEILGNPILTHNMEYKLLFYTQNIECDDPIWNEYLSLNTVTPETINFFATENFIETVTNTNSVAMLISDKLKYDRIFGKLFNGDGIQIGCACITACFKPFEPEDIEIFGEICNIVAKKLDGEERFQEYAREYNKRMIGTLIEGTYEDKLLYSPHVANIYHSLDSKIYVMAVDTSKNSLAVPPVEYIRRLKAVKDGYKYYEYGDGIVIVLSTQNKKLSIEKDLPELNELFFRDNVYAGVSNSFDNLFELNKYYIKAKAALNNGQKTDGKTRIFM